MLRTGAPVSLDRRFLLSGLVGLPAGLLGGCASLIDDAAGSCPSNPAASGGVDWIPDVAHPVAWGEEHLTTADGAPRTLSIYYPSPRFIAPRPLLEICLKRWPVVLFLHGQPPTILPPGPEYHRRWWRVPIALARSGYVVIVPSHTALLPNAENAPAGVAAAVRDLDWIMTDWHGADRLDKRATSTVVAGHSYGALLAARVAAAREVGAFVSLSGPYQELNDRLGLLQSIKCPSFFMFSTGNDGPLSLVFEQINDPSQPANNLWDQLSQDRYAATFDGGHFDYLQPSDTGGEFRGACSLVAGVAADLAALFVASNVQSLTAVPIDLRKPQVQLTPAQQDLAIVYLQSVDQIATRPGCRVNLKWSVDGTTGARQLGP